MIPRHLENKIVELLGQFRIVSISGPRQSGKTTLVRRIAQKRGMTFLTFDDVDLRLAAESDPRAFIAQLDSKPVVLDEIQLVPDILPYVKLAVDEVQKPGQFLFTGSTDIFAMSRVNESLAGRMVRTILYPLSLAEIHHSPANLVEQLVTNQIVDSAMTSNGDFLSAVKSGGYPELVQMDARYTRDWYESYLDARIERDSNIVKRISAKNRSQLKPLLRLCAAQCAGLINVNRLASDLRIDNNTVASDLALLEALYIIKRLKPWSTNLGKREVKTPKLHFVDAGLAAHLTGVDIAEIRNAKIRGQIVETFVFGELQKATAWSKSQVQVYHFRANNNREVDFVLESQGGVTGVEVKSGSNLKDVDFRGLLELKRRSPDRFNAGYMFYNGNQVLPRKVDGETFWMIPLQAIGKMG